MKRDDHIESEERLKHILKAIEEIEKFVEKFVENKDKESFCEDELLNNAVLYNFTIIGEAINYVETDKLKKYPYPWHKVRAFRNMIAHEYFNIKLSAV